jgi:ABC-2 type transport system ATP-binding protein
LDVPEVFRAIRVREHVAFVLGPDPRLVDVEAFGQRSEAESVRRLTPEPAVGTIRLTKPALRRRICRAVASRAKICCITMLAIKNLRKSFGSVVAVDDVSFTLGRGQLLGLLGPNGAGKTTTVSMIAGLVTPEQGEVLIEGARLSGDTDLKKRRIGLVPQDLALYDELSARANLRFFGALYGLSGVTLEKAIASAMELVGLIDRIKDRVATYSGGMKRRLNLAAGLLHDPDILLLDEPTVGVDPQSRNAIFDNLELLKRRGKALLYTTHYMEEVERLADRIVVMDHGRVIAEDTLDGLQSRVATVGGGRATLESVFLTLTGRSLRD